MAQTVANIGGSWPAGVSSSLYPCEARRDWFLSRWRQETNRGRGEAPTPPRASQKRQAWQYRTFRSKSARQVSRTHAAYIAREGKYAARLEKGERLEAEEAGDLPAWAQANPQEFWQAADRHERANGATYREFEIALPRELAATDRLALVREFIQQELGDRHAYQFAIHCPTAIDGKTATRPRHV